MKKKTFEYLIDDVIAGISDKIISRHTWVFGDDKASTPEEWPYGK